MGVTRNQVIFTKPFKGGKGMFEAFKTRMDVPAAKCRNRKDIDHHIMKKFQSGRLEAFDATAFNLFLLGCNHVLLPAPRMSLSDESLANIPTIEDKQAYHVRAVINIKNAHLSHRTGSSMSQEVFDSIVVQLHECISACCPGNDASKLLLELQQICNEPIQSADEQNRLEQQLHKNEEESEALRMHMASSKIANKWRHFKLRSHLKAAKDKKQKARKQVRHHHHVLTQGVGVSFLVGSASSTSTSSSSSFSEGSTLTSDEQELANRDANLVKMAIEQRVEKRMHDGVEQMIEQIIDDKLRGKLAEKDAKLLEQKKKLKNLKQKMQAAGISVSASSSSTSTLSAPTAPVPRRTTKPLGYGVVLQGIVDYAVCKEQDASLKGGQGQVFKVKAIKGGDKPREKQEYFEGELVECDNYFAVKQTNNFSRRALVREAQVHFNLEAMLHISVLCDVIEYDGMPMLVTEWANQGSLKGWLRNWNKSGRHPLHHGGSQRAPATEFRWTQAVELAIQLTRGLHALHNKANIVHQDLKPGNLLLFENFLADEEEVTCTYNEKISRKQLLLKIAVS
jgi:hypothetical protein